jgi:hypothetical protein
MAATNFTPISLYYSATASATPTAGNLVAGELALNTNDGKLFYKDSSGVVQTLASKAGNVNVSSFSAGTTGLTPSTASTGTVTLAGTLNVANGGTGVTTSTGSGNVVLSTSPTLVTPILGTPTSVTLTNGTGLPLTTGVTGTLPVGNGGTGLTTLTSGYIPYGNGTSAFGSSTNLFWDSSNSALGVGTSSPNTYGKLAVSGGNISVLAGGILRTYRSDNATYNEIKYVSSGDLFYLNQANGGAYQFNISGTEYMRLSSAGYLGIGTSSPANSLEVATTGINQVGTVYTNTNTLNSAKSLGLTFGYDTANGGVIASAGVNKPIAFWKYDSGSGAYTQSAVIDGSGNLGLGVTPSAWGTYKAYQVGNASLWGPSTGAYVSANLYYNGANRIYISNGYATEYDQTTGTHQWFVAPSGTAGGTVSLTQAMTLDNSGNLGVGTTSPGSYSAKIVSNGTISILGGNRLYLWDSTNTYTPSILANGNALTFVGNSGTEAMRIDSSGNLLVGTTNTSPTTGIGNKITVDATAPYFATVGSSSSSGNAAYTLYSTGAGAYRFYVDYGGTVHATSTSITAISDQSLKTNIKPLETGLAEVMKLQPRRFDWINGDATNVAGFVAQEVQEVLPDLVGNYKYSDTETKLGLKMGDMIPTLVKAIQEQQAIIEQLKAKVGI